MAGGDGGLEVTKKHIFPDEPWRYVQAIVLRHARIATRNTGNAKKGQALKCNPTKDEREGRKRVRFAEPKVIYDTLEAAEAAAAEMVEIGLSPQRAFECPRSKHGHHHLTTDRSPGTKKKFVEVPK